MPERRAADPWELLRLLEHPRCPWEPRASRASWRQLSVDRFLGFAFSQGIALAGLEQAADELVERLGGRRRQGGALPYYHVPAGAVARARTLR